jgi:hypothetical protein
MSWESVHGMWPAVIVQRLRRQLPPGYVSAPKVRLGPYFEVDIGTFDRGSTSWDDPSSSSNGGLATKTKTISTPTFAVETDIPEESAYEIEIFDNTDELQTLVAVIELVSPANKDREDHRKNFVSNCGALLRQGISVTILDIVTIRSPNLYVELLDFIGHADPTMAVDPPATYAASCRWESGVRKARLETWSRPLTVGQPLPTLPLWLGQDLAIEFDYDRSYEAVCDDLGIP